MKFTIVWACACAFCVLVAACGDDDNQTQGSATDGAVDATSGDDATSNDAAQNGEDSGPPADASGDAAHAENGDAQGDGASSVDATAADAATGDASKADTAIGDASKGDAMTDAASEAGALTCCSPKTFTDCPNVACGTLDDGCGGPLYCGCNDGDQCGTLDATGKGTCSVCVPQVTCAGLCGQVWNGCDTMDCGDTCAASGKICGASNECCVSKTTAELCAGKCGSIIDPCMSFVDCGDCDSGTCNLVTNTCCVAQGNPCTPGVCGLVVDSCNSPVDCGNCSGDQICGNGTCVTKACRADQCGYLPSGEFCGQCPHPDTENCYGNRCVPVCGDGGAEN